MKILSMLISLWTAPISDTEKCRKEYEICLEFTSAHSMCDHMVRHCLLKEINEKYYSKRKAKA